MHEHAGFLARRRGPVGDRVRPGQRARASSAAASSCRARGRETVQQRQDALVVRGTVFPPGTAAAGLAQALQAITGRRARPRQAALSQRGRAYALRSCGCLLGPRVPRAPQGSGLIGAAVGMVCIPCPNHDSRFNDSGQ
jgi:hypothetical protein